MKTPLAPARAALARAALVVPLALFTLPAAAAEVACLVETNTPELAPDARTVALLTCDALRSRGVDIGEPVERADGPAWRVGLYRLGDQYLVRLARSGLPGQPDAAEQLRLDRLGDIDKAAPRLAEAMTGGRPLAQSQEMETVTRAEAQRMEKKSGDFLYGLGVFGIGFIGTDEIGSFGFQFAVAYETPAFGAHAALRGGGAGGAGQDEAAFFEGSVGARYFFSPTDTAVYVGAGLAGAAIGSSTHDAAYGGGGLGAYGEAGVEFLRLYRSRLAIEARISVPFFELDRESWLSDEDSEDDTIYVVPVTVGLSYYW